MLPFASLSLSPFVASDIVESAVRVLGVRGVAGETGAEEERLPGGEGMLSRLSLLELRTALAVAAVSEVVDDLERRLRRDGLDCGLRSPLGGCKGDKGRRDVEEESELSAREVEDCDEFRGLDEATGPRGLAMPLPGGLGKASMLTALRRLGAGTRDAEGEGDGDGDGDSEDAWVRRVGIDGDEVTDRGIPVAARARRSAETRLAAASAPFRSLSDGASSAGSAPRIFVIAGNGGSGIDGGGCACGLRNC